MEELEKRMAKLEDHMRLMLSGLFQVRKLQERQYEKMMEGFRAIEKAFKLNCSKQFEMNEILDDYSSYLPGETVLRC